MRVAVVAVLAVALGCGVVSGIDDLQNVAGVAPEPDATSDAAPPADREAGIEAGKATCAELFCEDFEGNDPLAASRVSFSGPPGALDDTEHKSGTHSVRFSVDGSGAAGESAMIPRIAPIPIDGRIVISFAYKRGDGQSAAAARFDVGVEALRGVAGDRPYLEQSGSDLATPNELVTQNAAPIGVFSVLELSLTKTGPGSAAGRVRATLELRIDGVSTGTLPDLDIADTVTDVVVGDVGQPIQTTTVWIDDLVVSKR